MIDFNEINIIFLDLDGTLTDGFYNVSSNGIITKSFYTRDFHAIEKVLNSGMNIVIITNSADSCIDERIGEIAGKSAQWEKWIDNSQIKIIRTINKKRHIEEIYISYNKYKWENMAYMGDAENDLECMKEVAFSGCPSDSMIKIQNESNFVSGCLGGKGAVEEFINYILEKKGMK